jgi:hypothetical protein
MTRPRPTYANVAATLALVVALSGTAYAAGLPQGSVGAKQLKKNAVTSAAIKKGAVKSADVADRGIQPADLSAASRALAASGPTVLTGGVHDVPTPVSTSTTRFGPLSGHAEATTEIKEAATLSWSRPAIVSNLQVRAGAGLDEEETLRVDIVSSPTAVDANATTLLSCTLTVNPATCRSTGTATVPAGSFVYARAVVTAIDNGSGGQVGNLSLVAYSMTVTPVG